VTTQREREMSASACTGSIPGYYFDPGTQFPGEKKIMLCKEKHQAGMVITVPSQNLWWSRIVLKR